MIKETDGDRFEEMRSLEQNLTFEKAGKEFADRNIKFGQAQMKTLGLMTQDGVYTNLGLLLSDQCVHTIKAAVFEGTNQNQFKDRKEFTGSLFKQMDDVYDFIDFRNQIHSTFEKLRRIDRRDYPEVAVREALLNLLVHREYSFRSSTFISIYTDRMEFTSIGGLVSGVTLKDVTMGISVCRNAKLANVFYRLELIEAYGTGILKIIDAYEGTGMTPEIETSDNAFKVILPNLNAKTWSKEPENTGYESCTAEEKVIALVRAQGYVTRKEMESLLGMSQTTCGRLLKQMTRNGQIVQTGRGKITRYCFPENGAQ
jgi:ATP-dependent DNA helicase RecG